MRKPHIRRLGEGITLTVLAGVILFLVPSQIDRIPGMETEVSPFFLPTVLAVAIMAVGIALLAQAFRKNIGEGEKEFPMSGGLRVLVSVLLLIAYTLLFPRLGFLVTSGIFMGIFTYYFGARSILKIGLSMLLVPVCVWLFFEKLFRIPLPHGLIF